jgi:hypothetical protein
MEEAKNKAETVTEKEWDFVIKNFGKDSSKRTSLVEIIEKHKVSSKKTV